MVRRFAALAALVTASAASTRPVPLTIGEQHVFEAMDAEREVNVVLPLSYGEEPERRYPVVYFLDGGVGQDLMMQVGVSRWTQMWGRTDEFILVGIETKDRQRELLPPTSDKEALEVWPTAGESALFRGWIRDTVLPMVAADYRTDGNEYLVGESAAGHFVVETMLAEPDLFDGYAAIDPSLWWEQQLLAKAAEANGAASAPLFISIADEGETMDQGVRRVVAARTKAGANTCFADRPDLTHATAYHTLLPGALQYMLPGPEPLPEEWHMTPGCSQ